MSFMKLYKNLHGLSKKIIVIEAIKKIVELQKLSPDSKQALIAAIDLMAPPIIDTIYNVAIQKINFNPKNSTCCVPRPREK